MNARDLVKTCRSEIPADIKGAKLRPLLIEKVDAATRGLAAVRPYSTWINKRCGDCKAPRLPETAIKKGLDPDPLNNLLVALKFRAYPSIDSDMRKFDEWMGKVRTFWSAAMNQVRHAASWKHWDRLKALCSATELSRYFDKVAGNIPVEIKRDALKRFSIAVIGVKKGKPCRQPPDRFTMSVNFNGGGTAGQFSKIGAYCEVGPPYSPPNHAGPRTGKYRGAREIRKVRIRLNSSAPWFELDVLFHRPLVGCPKAVKLTRDESAWFVAFSMEAPLPPPLKAERCFAGLDYNWREDGEELSTLDIGGKGLPFTSFNLDFVPNRRTRRQAAGIRKDSVGLPMFDPTPSGRKAFRKEIDARKDAIKTRLGLPQNFGWHGIANTIAPDDSKAFLAEELAWYGRAKSLFKYMCGVETENRLRQFRLFATSIAKYCVEHGVTDVGSPDDSFKDMAEQERKEGIKNWESRICNVRDENRQIAAPGKLREIIEHTLRKIGVRVHRINNWRTSQRCECGHDTKTFKKTFTCQGCGNRLDRSLVAVSNASKLAFECSCGDSHARVCSKNGKDLPFHGFQGCDEAIAKKKEENKQLKARRSKKMPQPEVAVAVA